MKKKPDEDRLAQLLREMQEMEAAEPRTWDPPEGGYEHEELFPQAAAAQRPRP